MSPIFKKSPLTNQALKQLDIPQNLYKKQAAEIV